jgi:hypothetical protein
MKKGIILYDFKEENEGEISCLVNDIVNIINVCEGKSINKLRWMVRNRI